MTGVVPVVVNRGGGTATAMGDGLRDAIKQAFADAGITTAVHMAEKGAVRERIEALRGEPIIVVGGGDGTLGCAADCLAGSESALGILPLGTRNHLARELGVPLDLVGAARTIASGTARAIDLARVNGHAFVNNASIGLYPSLVRFRDAERERHPLPKWLAALPASYAAVKRIRHHRLRIVVDGSAEEIVTPMLFVGNNRYMLARGRVGEREALDDGKLSVFAVTSRRRLALIGFGLRALAGRADPERDFAMVGEVARLRVEGRSRTVDVAIDGEVHRLAMPLRFASEPGALRVIAPLEGEAATA